jgi:hypothetical protein
MPGIKLPAAAMQFNQKQSELGKVAARIYSMMGSAQGIINFPTPAVALTDLVTAINNYTVSLSTTGKNFSKDQTALKNVTKKALINLLRTQALYVTQTAQLPYVGTGTVNTTIVNSIEQIILSSGFAVSNTPGPVANQSGSMLPVVKHAISKSVGTFYLLLRNYTKQKKGVKIYQVNYRTSEIPAVPPATVPTPAGPIKTWPSTSGDITVLGLTPGLTYDWQVGVVTGHNTRLNAQNPVNFTPWEQIVIQ